MTHTTISRENPKEFKENWKFCIGTGRLGLALQKEYLEHLKIIQEQIGFKYIRGHGLLHDDIGIYREIEVDGETKPFYNFTYIDRIFDSFLELNLRPFVEIGFMPKLLASDTQTIFAWEGNVTPPKDYKKWRELIQAVVSHFIERYGEEEVLTWPFEIWNEPNLENFWKDADRPAYLKLYKETVTAIKEVNSNILVGGPAICATSDTDEWLVDFLQFCKDEALPVDFVTRHAYTSKQPNKVTPDYYYQDLESNGSMLEELKHVRGLIKASPFPDSPFHITEYNTSYSPINPIHDTTYNAAYLGRILSEGADFVDSFSYWTFSDVFEERDVPRAQFHGGFGLIALNSVLKPTFHLFRYFNQLGSKQLYRDEDSLVTEKEDGTLVIVAWNPVEEKGKGFEKTLEFQLPFDCEEVFIKRETVDEAHANPWKVWQDMGRPRFPSQSAVETLKQAAHPFVRSSRGQVKEGQFNLSITLTKNEVTLLVMSPLKDETHTYIGLDDSLVTSY